MRLKPDEYDLFSKLYNSLLEYAGKKTAPKPPDRTGEPDYDGIIAARDALFQDRQLIERFVQENPYKFSPQELEIVASWKNARVGDFYILRNLKRYTIFVGCKDNHEPTEEIFGVLALGERFEDIVKSPLPALVRTALLPFQEKIVFDGILSFYKVDFGPDVRQLLDGCFKYVKEHMGVITSLAPGAKAETRKPKKSKSKESKKIRRRLEEVMAMIPCPIAGCWSLHGAETAYYFDRDCECHVLEVWPVGFVESVPHGGNGHPPDDSICYEFAEFDFINLAQEVSLETFHFSQRRQIFEIAWKEDGKELELRLHLVPQEVDEE